MLNSWRNEPTDNHDQDQSASSNRPRSPHREQRRVIVRVRALGVRIILSVSLERFPVEESLYAAVQTLYTSITFSQLLTYPTPKSLPLLP